MLDHQGWLPERVRTDRRRVATVLPSGMAGLEKMPLELLP